MESIEKLRKYADGFVTVQTHDDLMGLIDEIEAEISERYMLLPELRREGGERMSLRNIEVQYVGDTLYLPPLEREVKRITVRKPDVNGYEYFEKLQTCRFIEYPDNYPDEADDGYCSRCHEYMFKQDAYCPACGAKVVNE